MKKVLSLISATVCFLSVTHLGLGQSSGVINTRPVCAPLLSGLQPCNSRYVQGPSPIRLSNGDIVILVNAGYGGFNTPGSGEGIHALLFPNDPSVKPRWYPIYGTNSWAGDQSGNEHEAGFPTALFFNGSWRTIYTQTFFTPVDGRDARIDAPTLTSQPAFRDPQWLKPPPPCEPLGSCPGGGSGFDMAVESSGGIAYDYRSLGAGSGCPGCPFDPDGPGHTICYVRTKINSDLTYSDSGCLTFPAASNPYTPQAPSDIGRGTDGAYYMIASHYPYQNFLGEWKSADGISWSYNNRLWQADCQAIHDSPASVDSDCNVPPPATGCFIADGGYVKDSTGLIVEPRIVVGNTGCCYPGLVVDGSWHLYYWADAGAALPATWAAPAAACPPPYVVAAGVPSFQGNFDGFTTDMQSAGGWAWDWYQPNTVQNVSVYVDSTLFTTLSANQLRGDLLNPPDPRYYYGNGVHGWTWPVASFFREGLQHTVDIRYSGTATSLSNSPRTYKIAAPSSVTVSPTSVVGGASATLTVNLTQAAPTAGLTVLLSSSTPTVAGVPGTKLVTGTSGTVTVTTSPVAGVTNATLRASSGNVTKSTILAVVPNAPAYGGNFDGATCDAMTGWAWNANFPNATINVTIKEGSTVIVSGWPANIFRQGLPGNSAHAFSFPVPVSMKNGQAHTVTVQFTGTSQLLPNGTKTFTCGRLEQSLVVDVHSASGTTGNLNGIFEPGETVRVEPKWKNTAGTSIALTGIASSFGSPQGGTFTLSDTSANYGTLASGAAADCNAATGDCYKMGVSGSRPAPHWDATFLETLSSGEPKTWTLHIGASFTDVLISSIYYPGIETVLHAGITAGCGGSSYCPADPITRAQMSVFLVKAKYGAAYVPPPSIGIFGDVAPGSFAADFVEQLYRDGITVGCGSGNYCPTNSTTRAEMAVFLLKTKNGSGYLPPVACGCVFTDVHVNDFAAAWIEALQAANAVATGYCGTGKYCPNDATTREQMATFITKTFAFAVYGP